MIESLLLIEIGAKVVFLFEQYPNCTKYFLFPHLLTFIPSFYLLFERVDRLQFNQIAVILIDAPILVFTAIASSILQIVAVEETVLGMQQRDITAIKTVKHAIAITHQGTEEEHCHVVPFKGVGLRLYRIFLSETHDKTPGSIAMVINEAIAKIDGVHL